MKSKKPIDVELTDDGYYFMKNRYVVLRDFIPKDIIKFMQDCWLRWENSEQGQKLTETEYDTGSNSPEDTHNTSESPMDNSPWAVALTEWATPRLMERLKINLIPSYAYSRKYYRNGYMKVHHDRVACEVSFTMPLMFKTDGGDPWTIWVDNREDYNRTRPSPDEFFGKTQGLSINERNRTDGILPIKLNVGDVMVYQGPNVLHWRDRLVGDYSYHIFCHWHNADSHALTKLPELIYDGRESIYHDNGPRSNAVKEKWHQLEIESNGDSVEWINRYPTEWEVE